MANMTALESADMTTAPYNSTLSPNTMFLAEIGVGDSFGHNVQARIGYYYPLRLTETLFGLVGNFMVILAVCRNNNLQTATGSLLANLALADMLAASLTIFSIIVDMMDRSSRWLQVCISKEILYLIAGFGNFISLSMISVDRLISLTKPCWYHARMTVSKVLPWQIITWIGVVLTISLVLTLRSTATLSMPNCVFTFLLTLQDQRLLMLYPYCFFTGMTIVNYIILGIVVWRQGRQVLAHCSTVGNHIRQRQRKLTKTTALVVILYLALTIPLSVTSLTVKDKSALFMHGQYVSLVCWYLNTVINPFIYAYRMPKFRQAFRKMFGLKPSAVAPAPAPVQLYVVPTRALLAAALQVVQGHVQPAAPGT